MTDALAELYPANRLGRIRAAAADVGLDAVLLTPGPDLRYATGYDAIPLERLTCLVVPTAGAPFLVVPRLELPAAQASRAGSLDLELVPWEETEDPYELVARRLGRNISRVGVADRMWAVMALRFRAALSGAEQFAAGGVLKRLRIRKSLAELAALREAGTAIDRVHAQVPGFLRPGRTEREVARDIADAIIAEGHESVDFVIVGAGPNGANPHAEVSDRVLAAGEPIVVDIGGVMPSGYCSDSTRNYCIGEPPPEYREYFAVLREAQAQASAAVRPGVAPAAVDAVARGIITEAGFGQWFLHRTGHGIGLETHEDPYLVAGNTEPLEAGMAFSIEPGIYPGPHGARIEDIVACTPDGHEPLNLSPRDLVIVS